MRFGDSYELPSSRFDTTPPSVSLTSPTPNGSIGSTLPLAATATDNVGVQRVDFLIDGSLVYSDDLAPYQYTADTSALGDGTHTVTAIAYDTSGNASAPSSVTMAKGVPTLTGFSPAGGPVGTAVTLGGAGLSLATAVAFNGSAAQFTVDSDTQITATVPAAATSGPISVTTPGGTATSAKIFSVTPPTAKLALKLDGLSAGVLRLGERVTASVHLMPTGLPDERVTFTIERRRKGHWHAVVTRARTTSSTGLATLTYKPAHKGTYPRPGDAGNDRRQPCGRQPVASVRRQVSRVAGLERGQADWRPTPPSRGRASAQCRLDGGDRRIGVIDADDELGVALVVQGDGDRFVGMVHVPEDALAVQVVGAGRDHARHGGPGGAHAVVPVARLLLIAGGAEHVLEGHSQFALESEIRSAPVTCTIIMSAVSSTLATACSCSAPLRYTYTVRLRPPCLAS